MLQAGNYQIPVGVVAILIEASGGGGGGSSHTTAGGTGGDTLVVNATAGIDILAPGGFGAHPHSPSNDARSVGARGGDFIVKSGASGGVSANNAGDDGRSGGVITRFLASDDLSGQALNITYGGGGGRASSDSSAGQPGWVKITIW